MSSRKEEVEHLRGLLKKGHVLNDNHISTVMSKLSQKLSKVCVPYIVSTPPRGREIEVPFVWHLSGRS